MDKCRNCVAFGIKSKCLEADCIDHNWIVKELREELEKCYSEIADKEAIIAGFNRNDCPECERGRMISGGSFCDRCGYSD